MTDVTVQKDQGVLFKLIKPFIYFFLGCFYTAYGLVYPFRLFYKIFGDVLFKAYRAKNKQINLAEIAPNEAANIKQSDNEAITEKEVIPQEPPVIKKTKKQIKQEKLKNALLLSMQEDATRSEVPIAFRYTAINSDGKTEINTFIAYSKVEVYTYLENENYNVLKIETSKFIQFLYGPTSFNAPKFKNKDLIFWLTQLSTYIKSGIPLTDSMRILGKQMEKDTSKKRVFNSIIYYLTLGESFSSALEKQRNVFPQLLINMIKAAEATGELEETLDDMAQYYTDIETTRKQMISAMSYPAIIMIFSIGVVVFILIYVIPQFQDVYVQAGAELNPLTSAVIIASDFIKSNIFYIFGIVILIGIIFSILYRKVKAFRHSTQKVLMRLPIVGKIIIYKEMNIFAKTFSSLLKNQVFITESISILTNITRNEVYREVMITTIDNIARGEKISHAFQNHWAVPDVAYYMIVTGESTGQLAEMMSKVADYYQESHKTIINSMKSFIEPAMIIFLAVVVGGIVLAVILPMFGLYSEIQ